MSKKNLLYLALACNFLAGCSETAQPEQPSAEPVQQRNLEADWLLGEWKYEDENGILHEDWSRKNDSVFTGESYFIEKGDTLFFEYLRLTRNGDSLFYESLGEDLVHPKAKVFKGLHTGENQFEIENPQHSFPRTIRYNQLNDTLMIIEVSGIIDGSEEIQPYQMVKTRQQE